ncbi:conserved hypothetical protein [uncultured Gammaproteobacteria bacterium]
MSDIFREVEEDIREERMHKLVNQYGPVVLAIALAVVVATAGTVWWKGWRAARQEAETTQFVAALAPASSQVDDKGRPVGDEKVRALAAAEALAKFAQGTDPAKAALARLYEAGLRGHQGGEAEAVAAVFDRLAAESGTDPALRDLATLLAVLRRVDSGDPVVLRSQLGPLSVEASPWRYTARELLALLALRTGEQDQARTLFQQLAEDPGAPEAVRGRAAELATLYGKKS